MNGTVVETVASSWIEALGGLSQRYMRNVPPCFWASAGPAASSVSAADAAATVPRTVLHDCPPLVGVIRLAFVRQRPDVLTEPGSRFLACTA